MYKTKLQELCQRRGWNLPEYTTVKDGPDHVPSFKATAVVNGQWFETQAECKSAKNAQNSVAKMAYYDFNISTPPRVHVQRSPLADSPVIPSRVPACSSPAVPLPEMLSQIPVACSSPAVPVPEMLSQIPVACSSPAVSVPEMLSQIPVACSSPAVPVSEMPTSGNGTLHIYKQRLQQHAQKKDLSLPVYTCEYEGSLHALHFKSRVSFDGNSYETKEIFPTLKEAEHAAAKFACQMLKIDQIQEVGECHGEASDMILKC